MPDWLTIRAVAVVEVLMVTLPAKVEEVLTIIPTVVDGLMALVEKKLQLLPPPPAAGVCQLAFPKISVAVSTWPTLGATGPVILIWVVWMGWLKVEVTVVGP